MSLYEVTNGYHGESYVRVYVWCASEHMALKLAKESFREAAGNHGADYWTNLRAEFLFSADNESFASKPSNNGFET